MRTADLVATARSDRLHVKASDIQPHSWYHEMFAGTLCGRWVRVEHVLNAVPLDTLASLDVSVCDVCEHRSRRFAR